LGVLLRDVRSELRVRTYCATKGFVFRKACLVERLEVQCDESLALLVGDLEVAVHIDDVLEAELASEAIGTAE
jgi:hypothetical protein